MGLKFGVRGRGKYIRCSRGYRGLGSSVSLFMYVMEDISSRLRDWCSYTEDSTQLPFTIGRLALVISFQSELIDVSGLLLSLLLVSPLAETSMFNLLLMVLFAVLAGPWPSFDVQFAIDVNTSY
jgi:hypothetical protein